MKRNGFRILILMFSFYFVSILNTSGWSAEDTLVEEFSFDMTQYNYHESPALDLGKEYYLIVSGTYSYGSGNLVDAAYRISPEPITPFVDHDGIFAWDDGDDVFPEGYDNNYEDYNHRPTPDEYNPDHIYYYYFTSDGTTEKFQWEDGGGYGDNSGSLTFQIWKVGESSSANYSLSFDGVDDYVEITDDGTLSNMEQLSLQAWIKPNRTGEENSFLSNWPGGNGTYLLNYDNTTGDYGQIRVNIGTTGGGECIHFLLTVDDVNNWIFITSTYDGDSLKLYKNGELKVVGTAASGSLNSGSDAIYLGMQNNYGGSAHYDGFMDEVSIWKKALTANEIQNTMYEILDPTNETHLLAYWNFNEGSGATLIDQSGNGNDGTIYGASWSTDVPSLEGNYSLSFDGVDDYTEIVTSSADYSSGGDFYFDGSLTLEAWFKTDDASNDHKTFLHSYSHTAHGDPHNSSYQLLIYEHRFQAFLRSQSGEWGANEGDLFGVDVNDGYWHHVAVVFDRDNSMVNAYLDGGNYSYQDDNVSLGIINPTNPIQIGDAFTQQEGHEQYWLGNIDEVRIWKRALTLEEIQHRMYNDLDPSQESNLSAYWKIDEGIGSTTYDSSGNEHHGTIYGAVWSEDVPPLEPSSFNEDLLDKVDNIPHEYFLKQNFPNPFNPSTNIEFTLPKSEFTTLKIYNILGKEVTTLVSNKLNQGNHTYTFDGRNMASGVYYYQLVAGDYREVKKMLFVK